MRSANATVCTRAGFCLVTQPLAIKSTEAVQAGDGVQQGEMLELKEHMLIVGGFAVSGGDPLEEDGTRARNDVLRTSDGLSWEVVVSPSGTNMPWGSCVFHGCVLWRRDNETESGQSTDAPAAGNSTVPRLLVTGGGYLGRRGNNEVREVEAYTDTWLSQDGAEWVKTNYEEGSKERDNLYSTEEW